MDLAVDCSNSFNQKYLLHVLQALVKTLIPAKSNVPTNITFGDEKDEEETEDNAERTVKNQFDLSIPVNTHALAFINRCYEMDFFKKLLLNINGGMTVAY